MQVQMWMWDDLIDTSYSQINLREYDRIDSCPLLEIEYRKYQNWEVQDEFMWWIHWILQSRVSQDQVNTSNQRMHPNYYQSNQEKKNLMQIFEIDHLDDIQYRDLCWFF